MKKFKNIEDVAQVLGDGGPFSPDTEFETIEEVVDALIALGNTDKVYTRHDDHLGLKDNLSGDFLNASVENSDSPKFESEIELVLEQANIIIPLSERVLSEDDIEEIKEDKASRGEDPDELDL